MKSLAMMHRFASAAMMHRFAAASLMHRFAVAATLAIAGSATAGTLRGTVTRADNGAPLAGVTVTASRPGFPFGVPVHTTTLSNAAGQYEFSALPAASYTVNANALGTDLVRQLYPSAFCPPQTCEQSITLPGVSNLPLADAQVLAGIDFALAQGGAIDGEVRRGDNQALLPGTTVTILPLGWQVQTDTSGSFHIARAPAGTWRLRASGSGDLVPTLYPNVPCELNACINDASPATAVALAAGMSLTRSIMMPVGASISGFLQPASAVANHTLRFELLYNTSITASRQVPVAADGSYRIEGLATGTYRLSVHSNVIRSQVYPDLICDDDCPQQLALGAPVATVLGQTTPAINFALSPAGRVAGIVTDASTGAPLADVQVLAYQWAPHIPPIGNPGAIIAASAVTAADGSYVIEGIPPQSIRIATSNTRGYRDERYDNDLCAVPPSCIGEDLGTSYAVEWGDVMTANFQLEKGASITGSLSGPGVPIGLGFTVVEVYDLLAQRVTGTLPNPDGSYHTTGMKPGAYRVRAIITFFSQILYGQVYGGVACTLLPNPDCDINTGTVLNLTAGIPAVVNIAIEPIFVGTFE